MPIGFDWFLIGALGVAVVNNVCVCEMPYCIWEYDYHWHIVPPVSRHFNQNEVGPPAAMMFSDHNEQWNGEHSFINFIYPRSVFWISSHYPTMDSSVKWDSASTCDRVCARTDKQWQRKQKAMTKAAAPQTLTCYLLHNMCCATNTHTLSTY